MTVIFLIKAVHATIIAMHSIILANLKIMHLWWPYTSLSLSELILHYLLNKWKMLVSIDTVIKQ